MSETDDTDEVASLDLGLKLIYDTPYLQHSLLESQLTSTVYVYMSLYRGQ